MSQPRRPHPVYGPDLAPVRLGTEADLPLCLAIDDGYTTHRLWQMDLHRPDDPLGGAGLAAGSTDLDEALGVIFRPVRLPRPLPVPGAVTTSHAVRLARWRDAEALLVVGPRPPTPPPPDPDTPPDLEGAPAPRPLPPAEVWGYVLLGAERATGRAWIQTLVVGPAHREQGLGSRLLDAAKAWARATPEEGGGGPLTTLMIALSPKNHPAITFCRRRGFRFCGYTDHTAVSGEVQLYFLCPLRG